MSLINEALKKAQRLRTEEQPSPSATPLPDQGEAVARPRPARSSNTLVLLGAGSVALVVLTVVITFYFANQPSAPAAASTIATHHAPVTIAPAPVTVAPTIEVPIPAIVPANSRAATPNPSAAPVVLNAPVAVAATPSSTPAAVESGTPNIDATPAPAQTAVAAAAIEPLSEPAPVELTRDPRVIAFVDSVRVTGIRFSGKDSRVLMNDRVYQVNDIVERLLQIRLTHVAADSLTFTDASGFTYEKNF